MLLMVLLKKELEVEYAMQYIDIACAEASIIQK